MGGEGGDYLEFLYKIKYNIEKLEKLGEQWQLRLLQSY